MIKEYGVKTLPTVIIKGEIDNTQLSKVFVRVKDALVAKNFLHLILTWKAVQLKEK